MPQHLAFLASRPLCFRVTRDGQPSSQRLRPVCASADAGKPPARFFARRLAKRVSPPRYKVDETSVPLNVENNLIVLRKSVQERSAPEDPPVASVVEQASSAPDVICIVSSSTHTSETATEDVIGALNVLDPPPDTVVLELCAEREWMISAEDGQVDREPDNAEAVSGPSASPAKANIKKAQQLETLLAAVSGPNDVGYARDMVAAASWARAQGMPNTRVVLGDRRQSKTFASWARQAGLRERLLLTLDAALAGLLRRPVPNKVDVAAVRNRMRESTPALYNAIYTEREQGLAWSARDSDVARRSAVVALVCGRAHTEAVSEILVAGRAIDPADLQSS